MHDPDQPDVTTTVICRAIAVLVFLFALFSFLQMIASIDARNRHECERSFQCAHHGDNYP